MNFGCSHCGGRGFLQGVPCFCKCKTCKGTGYIQTGNYCSHCNGTGRNGVWFLKFLKCIPCKGLGKGTRAVCTNCRGRTRNPSCRRCLGSGRMVCEVCNGPGAFGLAEQLAKLPIQKNSFLRCGDDPRNDTNSPLPEMTAAKVDALVARMHRDDPWGGVRIGKSQKSLRVQFSDRSTSRDKTICRVGGAKYVIY